MSEYEALCLTGYVTTPPLESLVYVIVRRGIWNKALFVNRRVPQCHHDNFPKLNSQYDSTPSRTFSHNTCSEISRSRFKLKLKFTAQPEQTRPDLQ
jgi:hypothetical protein